MCIRDSLTAVESTMFIFERIEVLNLSENHLKSIPEEIDRLIYLKSLILSDNELECLPASIGKLRELEYLYLSGNKLNDLPVNIIELKQLKCLSLTENYNLTLSHEQQNWIELLKKNGCEVVL